ncbi:hypothetical protein B0H10DRAFT_1990823 [Mycena sp. CBHHK59/15]|nr:hypothetical protein B0H10DRAFT_1990823 [Mycena sp. CBHHK59/15]
MSSNLAHANAEIILALSKMGIYMERDRAKLNTLSPAAQNTRLRKALDRAVDNCCIFQLLFSKESREMGQLVLEELPQWDGWRESRKELFGTRDAWLDAPENNRMERFVQTLGTHSLWAPFRMGRYSVTESASIQGASVRLKDDIPEMEDLQMRWLSFVSLIDVSGSYYPGGFWGLTTPLDVLEIQLPDDIDDEDNECGDRDMAQVGYKGNRNRRAIPIIVVRYATALPSLGSQKALHIIIKMAQLQDFDAQSSYLTAVQLAMFTRILESNSRRLAPSEIKRYQAKCPKYIGKETKISFMSPLYCPSSNLADQLEIGRRPRLSCAVCEREQSPDVKLFFCAACSGVAYCSSEHQSADWPAHKPECRSKKRKLPIGIRRDPTDSSSPIVRVVLPLDYRTADMMEGFGPKFCNYINPIERLRPPRKFADKDKEQCSKTVYAHGERFLVRARWGGHADKMFGVSEAERRSGKITATPGRDQGFLNMFMSILHFVDRPVSFGILLQKVTGTVDSQMRLVASGLGEYEVDNTAIFEAVVSIIKRSKRDKAEAAYFWATRKGDGIEIDLEDLPDQGLGW